MPGVFENVRIVARRVVGDRLYTKLRATVIERSLYKPDQAGFILKNVWPAEDDILRLNIREVSEALTLGLQYTYDQRVEGDVVEFGTASGNSALVLARAMVQAERSAPKKRLHLFDSFEGLPVATSEVDRDSFEVTSGIWAPGTCFVLNAEELIRLCCTAIERDRITVYKGWFADTVKNIPDGQRFAFVHVDGDMYQSAIDCLGGLFERQMISNGAIVSFDDFNCGRASPEHGERRAWRELAEQYDVKYGDFRAYGMMGRAFFVHEYRRA